MKILVLGVGFGGLALTAKLSDEFGDDIDVVLIDQSERFVFGFSKLDSCLAKPPLCRYPSRKVALLSDGTELPLDLFLGVRVHSAPIVVEESGLTVDGWIPVNLLTLETKFADAYAVGHVMSAGTAKAGIFSEGQAKVIAEKIIARVRGTGAPSPCDDRELCYLECGYVLRATILTRRQTCPCWHNGVHDPRRP